MAAVMGRALLVAVMAAAVLDMAAAADYTVPWDLQTNYATWVAGKRFHPGDRLTFTYSPQAHDVVEVSKADYDSCSAANPISTKRTGNDVVPLSATGTRYFLCGVPDHCTGGMKIKIDVMTGSGSTPSSPAPAGGPSAANTPPPPPSSSASSVTATTGFGLGVLVFGLMALY